MPILDAGLCRRLRKTNIAVSVNRTAAMSGKMVDGELIAMIIMCTSLRNAPELSNLNSVYH